ncbi:MAG TPA: sensor domain-containing diguanylate cyclase [Gemmatimonadaceae bacterium]
MHSFFIALVALIAGSTATVAALRALGTRGGRVGAKTGVSRVDAHLAAASTSAGRLTPTKTSALQREAQEVFETREATLDLAILDRLLRDIRDLTGADEAIFWRWVESRQTLLPGAWSTEGEGRPRFFDMRAWGPLVRESAEEREPRQIAEVGGTTTVAATPIVNGKAIFGVLTLTSATGLRLDGDAMKSWLPRFAAQVSSLLELFDLRREYARHMRQSGALLDAVQRMHGHRNAESLAQALCETAREVTSAGVAGLVRWNDEQHHGVVQAISPAIQIEAGFHVTADTKVGQACEEKKALLFEDAHLATEKEDPYGGLPRAVGSLAIVPICSGDRAIGALIVEGPHPSDVGQVELRNAGLLAALARGPLEIVWEIEEVTRRARTDSLTGLANRRHFDEQLRRVVAETDRFGGTCTLLLIDLDHFKLVNDRLGHQAGDAVLKHVAQVMRDAVRTVDLCARYGGEELAILLPQTSQEGAVELAERLRQMLEQRVSVHAGQAVPVTASFGVATYPTPVPYGDWLVLAADKALYEAKAAGRNCVKVISPREVTPALYKAR